MGDVGKSNLKRGFRLLYKMVDSLEVGDVDACRKRGQELVRLQIELYGENYKPGDKNNPLTELQDKIAGYVIGTSQNGYLKAVRSRIDNKMRELGLSLD